jgi:hypothetical protein
VDPRNGVHSFLRAKDGGVVALPFFRISRRNKN